MCLPGHDCLAELLLRTGIPDMPNYGFSTTDENPLLKCGIL
jgi:hypothetical protein